jgi:hypothetical protein
MRNLPLLMACLLLFSCGDLNEITAPNGGPIDPTATFTRLQNEIFTPNCTAIGCHDLIGRQEGLILVPGQAYTAIVGVPSVQMSNLRRIDPGNYPDSYLYRKVTGAGITGERMPSGGPPLTDPQIALIRDWIRRGAPND